MKFFPPNLKMSKNEALVKCKRVETAKAFGPEATFLDILRFGKKISFFFIDF